MIRRPRASRALSFRVDAQLYERLESMPDGPHLGAKAVLLAALADEGAAAATLNAIGERAKRIERIVEAILVNLSPQDGQAFLDSLDDDPSEDHDTDEGQDDEECSK